MNHRTRVTQWEFPTKTESSASAAASGAVAQADEALAQEMAAALQSDADAELAAKVQEQLKVEASSGGVVKGGLRKGPAKFTSSSMFKSDVKYCGQCGYGTTKPDTASCKQCAATQWLTTLDKARIEGATRVSTALLKSMIEVGVRRRGRQPDARAACASMQAVGVCDVRAWRGRTVVRTGGMSSPTSLLAPSRPSLALPALSERHGGCHGGGVGQGARGRRGCRLEGGLGELHVCVYVPVCVCMSVSVYVCV